jgi:hypothetical protein
MQSSYAREPQHCWNVSDTYPSYRNFMNPGAFTPGIVSECSSVASADFVFRTRTRASETLGA